MVAGTIVQSGGPELAVELESTGYTELVAEIMGEQPAAAEDDFLAGL
jgi:Fe-S cluster assembly ATPase SufC